MLTGLSMIFRNEATAGQWDDVECNKNLTFVCRFATYWKLKIRKSHLRKSYLVGLSVVGLPESIRKSQINYHASYVFWSQG